MLKRGKQRGLSKQTYKKKGRLSGVEVIRSFAEFFNNVLSELSAFTTIASYSSSCLNVSKIPHTIAAYVTNLMISNLAANTNVHTNFLLRAQLKSKCERLSTRFRFATLLTRNLIYMI